MAPELPKSELIDLNVTHEVIKNDLIAHIT